MLRAARQPTRASPGGRGGWMLCFAFGADLDRDVRSARIPEHRVVGLAALRDHQLSFPRFSQEWGGGVASIQTHHGDTLWASCTTCRKPRSPSWIAPKAFAAPAM